MKKLTVKCPVCNGKGNVPYEIGGHPHVDLVVKCELCKGEGKLVLEVLEVE